MILLGIETSCDETAAAVIRGERGRVGVLSNIVSSQIEIHKKYGGVVPEVAAREHVFNILPVIDEALAPLRSARGRTTSPCQGEENKYSPLTKGRCPVSKRGRGVDAIAVTIGPGLITSLQVGIETAKTLAYVWNLPLIAVNHIEAHIYANFIDEQKVPSHGGVAVGRGGFGHDINAKLPAIILTVSGGHTMLVLMHGHGRFETIGETRDDAAGEAFDKAASMLKIGYPGGPAIAHSASQITHRKADTRYAIRDARCAMRDTRYAITLPRPMIKDKSFDFSFSGLKTALRYELEKDNDWRKRVPEYAAEFQQAVIDVLIHKTIKAAQKYGVRTVMLAGGVAANLELRRQMKETISVQIPKSEFHIPHLKYTTDNAAMVAAAGYFKALKKNFTPWQKLRVDCNARL